jgi:Putative MetA-pathway of phenol degradation
MRVSPLACLVLIPFLFPNHVLAQQRPLITEDPEVIGAGRVLFEAGVETGSDAEYRLSGLKGDQVVLPIGVSFGLGPIVELQFDSGYTWLDIAERTPAPLAKAVPSDLTHTSDVVDVTVATKVRIVPEQRSRPSIGVRFATRLPNASNESGLGIDTSSFFATLLIGKTVGSVRVAANAGLAIIGNPVDATSQSDQFVGGVSVIRALTKTIDVAGEVGGRADLSSQGTPPGTEPVAAARGAVRFTRGRLRLDAGVIFGITDVSPDYGATVGVTIVGQAFKP